MQWRNKKSLNLACLKWETFPRCQQKDEEDLQDEAWEWWEQMHCHSSTMPLRMWAFSLPSLQPLIILDDKIKQLLVYWLLLWTQSQAFASLGKQSASHRIWVPETVVVWQLIIMVCSHDSNREGSTLLLPVSLSHDRTFLRSKCLLRARYSILIDG